MTDPTEPTPEVEERLRRALASRAHAVEPRIAGADPADLAERAAAARLHAARRRMVLSAAAVVAVVALAAGAFVLWPDSDDETDVATDAGDTSTTVATNTGTVDADEVIWPPPGMSAYDTPREAASEFMIRYLRVSGGCSEPEGDPAGRAAVSCPGPDAPSSTTVATAQLEGGRWGVTGASSSEFTAEPAVLSAGLSNEPASGPPPVLAALIAATGGDLAPPVTAELRPLGALRPTASVTSDLAGFPIQPGSEIPLHLAEPATVNGPHVLVVTAAGTASVTLFDPSDLAAEPPPTITTTTDPATDDGVPGWPGPVSRVFDDPEAAAQAFVEEVLQFADPALADATGDDTDMIFEYHHRPTAGISTAITVHNTGNVRGWVVTGLQGSAGTIDSVTVDGTTVTVTGSAQAFEATVSILVLDEQGTILGESFTMAGSSEVLPYQGTVEFDPGRGTPFWVMIAEGDASGDGVFTWATTATL